MPIVPGESQSFSEAPAPTPALAPTPVAPPPAAAPAPVAAPKDDFSDLVQNIKTQDLDGLKRNSFATEDLHPDREAEVIKLSDKFKVRPDFIREHFDDFAKTASAPDRNDLQDLVEKNPH